MVSLSQLCLINTKWRWFRAIELRYIFTKQLNYVKNIQLTIHETRYYHTKRNSTKRKNCSKQSNKIVLIKDTGWGRNGQIKSEERRRDKNKKKRGEIENRI